MTETRSTPNARKLERWVFLFLGITVAVLAIAYVWRSFQAREAPLPVSGQVTPFILTNQLGQRVTLDDLRGKIWIADIIFTRCAGPCPLLSAKFKELHQTFAGVSELRFVSLTADPAHDTPEVLFEHAKQFDAQPGRWVFLTGPKAELYRLAMDGLKLAVEEKDPGTREDVNDLFIHSTVFTLVDRRGRLRGFYRGLESDSVQELEKAVKKLAAED